MREPRRVLFLCTHNSARSQMAEGLLRELGAGQFAVFSAGTEKTAVRPEAISVMAEIGIDIGGHESKTLDRYLTDSFDEVITVCDDANDSCPYFPNARNRRHWSFPDPSRVTGSDAERLESFRQTRMAIQAKIAAELLGESTG